MPSLPRLRERGLPTDVSEILAKPSMEGGLDVRARRLDDGLYCLTEDAAAQLQQRKCSFFAGSPLLRNGRHLTVIRVKMSALHVATSYFYHDNCCTQMAMYI